MRGVNETQGRRLPLHHRAATVAADDHHHPPRYPSVLVVSPVFGYMCRWERKSHPHFLSSPLSPCRIARFRGAHSRGANIVAALRVSLFFKETTPRVDVSYTITWKKLRVRRRLFTPDETRICDSWASRFSRSRWIII